MQGEYGRMHHLSKEDTESRHSPCWRPSPCWRSRHRLCSFHSSASISGTGPGLFTAGEHLTSQGLQAGHSTLIKCTAITGLCLHARDWTQPQKLKPPPEAATETRVTTAFQQMTQFSSTAVRTTLNSLDNGGC